MEGAHRREHLAPDGDGRPNPGITPQITIKICIGFESLERPACVPIERFFHCLGSLASGFDRERLPLPILKDGASLRLHREPTRRGRKEIIERSLDRARRRRPSGPPQGECQQLILDKDRMFQPVDFGHPAIRRGPNARGTQGISEHRACTQGSLSDQMAKQRLLRQKYVHAMSPCPVAAGLLKGGRTPYEKGRSF